jgi:predicted RNA methylase
MHWNTFRKIRNEATSLVRNAKDKYNNDLIKKITNMNSSLQDNHLGPPFRIVTILLGIEDSAALKIALVISFVINSISSEKYNNDLIKKITNMNSSCKDWWNIVKQISGIKGYDMSIPPILHTDNLIFDDVVIFT